MKKIIIILIIVIIITTSYFIFINYNKFKKNQSVIKDIKIQVLNVKNDFETLKTQKNITFLEIIKKSKEYLNSLNNCKLNLINIKDSFLFKNNDKELVLNDLEKNISYINQYYEVFENIKPYIKKSEEIDKEILDIRGIYPLEQITSIEKLLNDLQKKDKKTKEDINIINNLKVQLERASKMKKMNYTMIFEKFKELENKNNEIIDYLNKINFPEDFEIYKEKYIENLKIRNNYLTTTYQYYEYHKNISDLYDKAIDLTDKFFDYLENSDRYDYLWMFDKALEELNKADEVLSEFKSVMNKINEMENNREKIKSASEKYYLEYRRNENDIYNVNTIIILKKDNKDINVNGAIFKLDSPPIEYEDRIFVPIKFIVEYLGGKISYNSNENKVTIDIENKKIDFWVDIDKKTIMVNNEPILIDVAPFTKYDRAYVPIRFISEILGFDVIWDNENEEVILILRNFDWQIFEI